MDFLARLGVAGILIGGGVIGLVVAVILLSFYWLAVVIGVGIWLLAVGLARVWSVVQLKGNSDQD